MEQYMMKYILILEKRIYNYNKLMKALSYQVLTRKICYKNLTKKTIQEIICLNSATYKSKKNYMIPQRRKKLVTLKLNHQIKLVVKNFVP